MTFSEQDGFKLDLSFKIKISVMFMLIYDSNWSA